MVETQNGSMMTDTVAVGSDTHTEDLLASFVLWYFVPFAAFT